MTRAARPASPAIQTGHPLYAKLVEFWYVATAGDTKMTGVKGTLDLNAAGTATTVTDSTHGAVALCDAADEAFSATALAAHKPTSGTWAAYWIPLETATQYVNVFGTSYDNALSSPYFCAGFYRDNAGGSTGSGITGLCSPGGSTTSMPVTPSSIAANYGVAITTLINCASGAQSLKIDNSSVGSAAVAGSTSSTATSLVRVGGDNGAGRNPNLKMIVCAIFTTPLDSTEQTTFDTDPWGLMRAAPSAPTLVSSTIASTLVNGAMVATYTEVWSAAVVAGASPSRTLHGTNATVGALQSGSGTTSLVFAITEGSTPGGKVYDGQTVTVDVGASSVKVTYWGGDVNNAASTGGAVTNNSDIFRITTAVAYDLRAYTILDGTQSSASNTVTFTIGDAGGTSTPGRWRGRGRGRGRL